MTIFANKFLWIWNLASILGRKFAIYSSKKPRVKNKYWFDIIKKYKNDYKRAHKLLDKLLKISSFKKVAYNTLVKHNYYDWENRYRI